MSATPRPRLAFGPDNPGASPFNSPPPLNKELIFELQLEQHRHDERYHPEISRLTIHHRLNHMALHFSKYSGRIAQAVQSGDDSDIDRTLIDIAIIALSSANVLNVRLGDTFENNIEQSEMLFDEIDAMTLLVLITKASGRMAKACESVDHLEAGPLREDMTKAVVEMFRLAVEFATVKKLDLVAEIHKRLEGVREKKIFHGCI